ncbi:hypothetical protein PROFUN_11149 [Planoprotostelium fungivorum]|uniref:Uncharacterized protein n=1 Tax=Planoprotostelium fungivorum TaxID=1890364 RepID=A0A2P6NAL7_9EUKA|nr:hypothetical protein PROFUN_11149 [Planoprotostelium fungivorum]
MSEKSLRARVSESPEESDISPSSILRRWQFLTISSFSTVFNQENLNGKVTLNSFWTKA